MADASAARPAQCAFSLKPPSNTNSTTSGIAAKIELTPSDPLTGSYTCLNMMSSPCPWSFLPREGWGQTGLAVHAGVPERVAAGLREDAQAVRPRADADPPEQLPGARRDRVHHAVVAAAQPEDLAVR